MVLYPVNLIGKIPLEIKAKGCQRDWHRSCTVPFKSTLTVRCESQFSILENSWANQESRTSYGELSQGSSLARQKTKDPPMTDFLKIILHWHTCHRTWHEKQRLFQFHQSRRNRVSRIEMQLSRIDSWLKKYSVTKYHLGKVKFEQMQPAVFINCSTWPLGWPSGVFSGKLFPLIFSVTVPISKRSFGWFLNSRVAMDTSRGYGIWHHTNLYGISSQAHLFVMSLTFCTLLRNIDFF